MIGNFSPTPTSSTPPVQPQQSPAAFKPNYDVLVSLNNSGPVSRSPGPAMGTPPQAQLTATPPPVDPFASLVSASPRASSSPFRPPQSQPAPASSSLLDLVGGPAPQAQAQAPAADDDEWNFASSLPASSALPSRNTITVLDSQISVNIGAWRDDFQPKRINAIANFSNKTPQAITDLHFQVAVEKVRFSHVLSAHKSLFILLDRLADLSSSPIPSSFNLNLVEKLHRTS